MPPDPPSLLPPSPSPPAQAVRCITQSAHSGEAILFAKLKTDLRKLMEKGRVYKAGSGELIAWGVRFFFGSEKGLCYQHVGRKLRPVGTKKVIPWGAITKVEALEDDSVYVETQALKRYYLKPKDSAQPAVEAWQWATAGSIRSMGWVARTTSCSRAKSCQNPARSRSSASVFSVSAS